MSVQVKETGDTHTRLNLLPEKIVYRDIKQLMILESNFIQWVARAHVTSKATTFLSQK